MKRRHAMPFGAEVQPEGATRFRIWAPAARRVALELPDERSRELTMAALGDGWHEITVGAPGGTRYSFRIDGDLSVPDPASRCNPDDVHAPSVVVEPLAFEWQDTDWGGRPWEEAVVYELHVGTFTCPGTFAAAIERLDGLAALGITAIELMPVADFPGRRNWGYDGVLPFAPDSSYGTPDDLKRLVQAAHARGLMVLLDVVYNHFGPEGNYLHVYAPQFFDARHRTPWGAGINFAARSVREFFVHNALYWLEEYHFDGLRLDAVHAIADNSQPDIASEIATAVRAGPGRKRHVHLVFENDRNQAHYLARDEARRPRFATAQWNDDVHHALHVILTGERDGYYSDYAERPLWYLGRALAEGFGYQGETSAHRQHRPRGTLSTHLPATSFLEFLQNHDQIGNRAFGERIGALASPRAVRAAVTCLLLAPSVPMLFMGEEFDASTPFLFFCDFGPELAAAVTRGRREEFGRFTRFQNPEDQATIPDPNDAATFDRSKLDWSETDRPSQRERLAFYRTLLALRREHIVPRLARMSRAGSFTLGERTGLTVDWSLGDGSRLHLLANLADDSADRAAFPGGEILYASDLPRTDGTLPPWSVVWTLEATA